MSEYLLQATGRGVVPDKPIVGGIGIINMIMSFGNTLNAGNSAECVIRYRYPVIKKCYRVAR